MSVKIRKLLYDFNKMLVTFPAEGIASIQLPLEVIDGFINIVDYDREIICSTDVQDAYKNFIIDNVVDDLLLTADLTSV